MNKVETIPGGWVSLLNVMGDDLDIVNAARISFDKHHEQIKEGDDKLIFFLAKNRHGTPFEMVDFMFQVRCPLTVAREWFRHRIASYNEMSGRYVKMEKDVYLPALSAVRTQQGKPGHYTFESVDDGFAEDKCIEVMASAYNYAYDAYEELLEKGIAKELARNVLPQGMFTEFRYKTNARSLMNFLSLRNAPNAMLEIRKYAEEMEKMFAEKLPITYEAFIKTGRIAP